MTWWLLLTGVLLLVLPCLVCFFLMSYAKAQGSAGIEQL
jgi:hypothetical protein